MEGMFKMIYMPNIDHDLLGFFFQFCKGGGLIIIARGMDQIWLELKQERTKILESCFILATFRNLQNTIRMWQL
jgi:hypothetical protein